MAHLQPGTVIVARYDVSFPVQLPWGHGQAWQATDRIFSRDVLLYDIPHSRSAHSLATARDIAQLTTDGLIRIVDILSKGDDHYVITEKPQGTTLLDLLASGPLPVAQARAIIGTIATTLDHTHEHKYPHGHLTPAHIWLSGSRIAVHGIAARNILGDNDNLGTTKAIERDIRGLAALYYFMLTGIMPDYTSREPRIIPLTDALPTRDTDVTTLTVGILMSNTASVRSAESFLAHLAEWDPEDVPYLDDDTATPATPTSPDDAAPTQVTRTSTRVALNPGRISRVPGTPPVATMKKTPESIPPATTTAKTATVTQHTQPPVPQRTSVLAHSPNTARTGTPLPQPDTEPPSRYHASSIITLVFFGVLLLGGLIWAVTTFNAPYEPAIVAPSGRPTAPADGDAAPGDDDGNGAAEPTQTPEEIIVPVIASATALDPQGDENEHPELEDRLVDGDPTQVWYSRTYSTPAFGNLKKGIGIAITLEKEAPVSSLLISSDNTGGNVQIRATSADKPTDGKVLAEGPLDGDTQLKFDSPVTTDTLVLWFTELPQQGTDNRAYIYEISVA